MTNELTIKQTVPPEKYELVKEQFAKGLNDNEFQVFIELCNRYGLDPFCRQMWAVKGYGSSPAQIIIARDGYLAIAHRSGQFDGLGDPEYETDEKGKVIHVRIRVYRKDMSHPFTGDAWDDEDNLHQSVWNKRQRTMLLKVAESRALRKAFSVSGTYCPEELGYDDNAPYKIDPKPSDIKVENIKPAIQPSSAAKPEPVKQPVAHNPNCQTVTVEEVNMRLIPAYQRQGFKLGVFTDADLGNGRFDKDMIDADFRQQAGISAPAPAPAPTPAPEAHPADGLDKFTAESIAIAEENLKLKAEQEKALKAFVSATQKAEASRQTKPTTAPAKTPAQTKPSATLSGDVCEVCGCKLLEYDMNICKLFTPGHKFCETHRNEYINSKAKGGSQ